MIARSTANLILAANIKVTQDRSDICHSSFTLYASKLVEDEATRGDKAISNRKLDILKSVVFLYIIEEAIELPRYFFIQN